VSGLRIVAMFGSSTAWVLAGFCWTDRHNCCAAAEC